MNSARAPARRFALPKAEHDAPAAAVVLAACRADPLRAMLKLSARGTLNIPVCIRRALAIEEGGALVAEATPDGLLLRPAWTSMIDGVGPGAAGSAPVLPDFPSLFERRRRRRMTQ
ncbi:MAG: AbrB/MazE/SpoVT family DNA-binding domain-containing protein [Betaproteobacteria bacterium]